MTEPVAPTATTPAPEQGLPEPLAPFARCHAGIRSQLDALQELPALVEAATRARQAAASLLQMFGSVVPTHHAEEEQELFPAVLASIRDPHERQYVAGIADRLTREHRQIEAAWPALVPALEAAARGRDAQLDSHAVGRLVAAYRAHADYEEQVFLPLAERILGRDGHPMAALGASLHMRHALPQVLSRLGQRI